jgi:hypothetical protein
MVAAFCSRSLCFGAPLRSHRRAGAPNSFPISRRQSGSAGRWRRCRLPERPVGVRVGRWRRVVAAATAAMLDAYRAGGWRR